MDIKTLDNLIDGYLEDRLDEQQMGALNRALQHSPLARQRFWEHAHLETYLVELAERKQGEDASHRLAGDDAIEILRQLEDMAHPDLVEVTPEPVVYGVRPPTPLERAIETTQHLAGRIGPVARTLAAAAVLGIVVLLGWQLITSPGSNTQTADNTKATTAPDNDTPGTDTTATPTNGSYATLQRTFDAQWQGPAPLPGQPLYSTETYTLTRGAVDLTMNSGAAVRLRAPASFTLSNNQVALNDGQAFADVPESAIGFTVDTPHGKIVDLGTQFGVRVDPRGMDEVVVFKGLVEAVNADADAEPIKIPENFGGTLRSNHSVSKSLQPIKAFNTDGYVRDWDQVIYQPDVFKGVYLDKTPGDLTDDATEADYIQVIPEARGVVLDQPITVTTVYPRTTRLYGKQQTHTLEPGTKVNSFLIHLDRPDRGGSVVVRQAEITFPGEVLGVIKHKPTMYLTDKLLGGENTRYPLPGEPTYRSSMDPFNSPSVDTVRLDADKRTLNVSFYTSNVDAIRVIVRNTDDEQPQGQTP